MGIRAMQSISDGSERAVGILEQLPASEERKKAEATDDEVCGCMYFVDSVCFLANNCVYVYVCVHLYVQFRAIATILRGLWAFRNSRRHLRRETRLMTQIKRCAAYVLSCS